MVTNVQTSSAPRVDTRPVSSLTGPRGPREVPIRAVPRTDRGTGSGGRRASASRGPSEHLTRARLPVHRLNSEAACAVPARQRRARSRHRLGPQQSGRGPAGCAHVWGRRAARRRPLRRPSSFPLHRGRAGRGAGPVPSGLQPRAKAQARPDQAPPRPRRQSALRTRAPSRLVSRAPRVRPPTWSRYCRTRFRSRSRFMAAGRGVRPSAVHRRGARPPSRRPPGPPGARTAAARACSDPAPRLLRPRPAPELPLPAGPRPGSRSRTRPVWRQKPGSRLRFRGASLTLGLPAVWGPWTPFLCTQGPWSRGASCRPCAVHSWARSAAGGGDRGRAGGAGGDAGPEAPRVPVPPQRQKPRVEEAATRARGGARRPPAKTDSGRGGVLRSRGGRPEPRGPAQPTLGRPRPEPEAPLERPSRTRSVSSAARGPGSPASGVRAGPPAPP